MAAVLIFGAPACMALLLAIRKSGWRKLLAWAVFGLMVLPAAAQISEMCFLPVGRAWRTAVKMPCAIAWFVGILILLVWALIAMSGTFQGDGRIALSLLQAAGIAAAGLFFLWIIFWCMFMGAAWAGDDSDIEWRGRLVVRESVWLDDDVHYTRYGPFVRGTTALEYTENFETWEEER